MQRAHLFAFITDFGLKDNFSGVVKGVIKSINQEAQFIDITHNISPQNINEAAFSLMTAYKYFPDNTVFLCIVDSGVGSTRDALIVKTKKHYFIAPDNGVLSLVLDYETPEKIIALKNKKYFLQEISSTFHARDIFAPAAAHLSQDLENISDFGEEMHDTVRLTFNKPLYEHPEITADIIYIDIFGNLITNIDSMNFKKILAGKKFVLNAAGKQIQATSSHYAEDERKFCVLFSSSGFLEIAKFKANAAIELNLKVGDTISITLS
jgi:S-adenosylmethionine hydrolase